MKLASLPANAPKPPVGLAAGFPQPNWSCNADGTVTDNVTGLPVPGYVCVNGQLTTQYALASQALSQQIAQSIAAAVAAPAGAQAAAVAPPTGYQPPPTGYVPNSSGLSVQSTPVQTTPLPWETSPGVNATAPIALRPGYTCHDTQNAMGPDGTALTLPQNWTCQDGTIYPPGTLPAPAATPAASTPSAASTAIVPSSTSTVPQPGPNAPAQSSAQPPSAPAAATSTAITATPAVTSRAALWMVGGGLALGAILMLMYKPAPKKARRRR